MNFEGVVVHWVVGDGDFIELSGWLVDKEEGLFILGDHYPEDRNYPDRVKIKNGNIIYPILASVASFGGGWSLLFYRAKICGYMSGGDAPEIRALSISVQADRSSEEFKEIDICDAVVEGYVSRLGDYDFSGRPDPTRDWLDRF
ncbi:hypothetical protein [Ralstonia solanacearum]|uniref:Uncharacterized protein n=1 Tax=Ralstonia solanacearum TaxID=305 RepID=A0AAE3NFY0_RALSL|nr:hypothetical protein [Ralstonia solanacearum]MBB6584441.1 hypothetical protein [Ralstonia solanacearum]MDB0521545.1 hypothetical protein [Ralstonia solanacearum]